jgi:hypothetical protein
MQWVQSPRFRDTGTGSVGKSVKSESRLGDAGLPHDPQSERSRPLLLPRQDPRVGGRLHAFPSPLDVEFGMGHVDPEWANRAGASHSPWEDFLFRLFFAGNKK